eukprot:TRINITY_DN10869_c0_g1_i3.p1 TRINITY_DN10869_c0_g1~~TRINITY_DN10869_c0_g1_i3.p1  ORF type:complete len:210 (+),score=62.22 TRINITY_DN10869_c0_g1_i3:69-698(+)
MAQWVGRKIYSTTNKGKVDIIYHAQVHNENARCGHILYCLCIPCSCKAYGPVSQALRESTYVQVLENRIEWNYPDSMFYPHRCDCIVSDNVKVLYFDRALAQNAAVAECCSPMCTHNSCCPTCFGMCGETLVLYENVPGCCDCKNCCFTCGKAHPGGANVGQIPRLCCVKEHILLPCITNAKELADSINAARDQRIKQLGIDAGDLMIR